jgi:hypothetical protein
MSVSSVSQKALSQYELGFISFRYQLVVSPVFKIQIEFVKIVIVCRC